MQIIWQLTSLESTGDLWNITLKMTQAIK